LSIRYLKDMDSGLWRAIVELYLSDPLTHCYLMYDLIYELNNIDVVLRVGEEKVDAYTLLWQGRRVWAVHLWGEDVELLKYIEFPRAKPGFIHLYGGGRDLVEKVLSVVKRSCVDVDVREFYDMVVDEKSFRPYNPGAARRLGEEDLDAFLEIKRVQGRGVDREEAMEILARGRYYGVYVDSELVAIAGRYVALPEVWVVGDVFVRPEYRGRGFGKVVTSAITRDAVTSGAVALLHVETSNIPAIRLYQRLGYRILRKRVWLYLKPR